MALGGPWWTRARLAPVVYDILYDTLRSLRPGQAIPRLTPGAGELSDSASTDTRSVGKIELDSLERIHLAMALSQTFHVHETGLEDLFLARRRPDQWVDVILDSRARWDEAITFATSGSTGAPTLCEQPVDDLEQEATFLAGLFADRQRVVGVQPTHHIYGFLYTFMVPAILGVPVVDSRDRIPTTLLRHAKPGDLIVAHPLILEMATEVPGRVAPDVTVVTSTGPCPRAVWDRLADRGVSSVIEVYGSSETGGISLRRSPDDPYELMPHWKRDTERNSVVRLGKIGNRSVTPPDLLEWEDSRHFRVLRRKDGAVQVGGVNVHPSHVRDCLISHPDVSDAAVRLMRPEEGRRLKAFIVPASSVRDVASLPDRLGDWIETRLRPAERPRSVTVGPSLPRNDMGKLADWEAQDSDGSVR